MPRSITTLSGTKEYVTNGVATAINDRSIESSLGYPIRLPVPAVRQLISRVTPSIVNSSPWVVKDPSATTFHQLHTASPIDQAPRGQVLLVQAPIQQTLVDRAPVDQVPDDHTPDDHAPADSTPIDHSPAEQVTPYRTLVVHARAGHTLVIHLLAGHTLSIECVRISELPIKPAS
ncbi:hypothetical protein AUEXF2481DRAFT_29686 [Aureobasidium subglaciale EXF-2481]|uniref:Uncharacterized protein n=1 Tax=Aureobasidium subglaciale (strain EXF-2481) TaxID=1043005 RepID=A0A074YB00_AURSE|nr:uncharacterized protein AUEXF2481DRAFT_29686 [Aureobasidium subglaciale EXF-2481]KEQ94955.1 hypothetical protein AUEXF2481DRAFT_29686 [Aureobasidium subglaciale EXF-2481]